MENGGFVYINALLCCISGGVKGKIFKGEACKYLMAIVGIFEDHLGDLRRRFGTLKEDHNVHICYLQDSVVRDNDEQARVRTSLGGFGFNPQQVYFKTSEMPQDADVYFSDGLDQRCMDIADEFGKDKVYIITGDGLLREHVLEMGYKLVSEGSGEVERIVLEHS